MRPLKLKISAFSCYANEQIIDFEALGAEGLYLITGDTGAGKTSIFDAITFSLYGKTSGDNRKAEMLRCKYAQANVATYVEFTFQYHDKIYTIKRNPTYIRAMQRGEGTTEEKAGVELHMPDGGPPLSKLGDVKTKIKAIIGLNREQFVRIAMIAQGEFLKVLYSSTEERIEIFRKIFYTDAYKLFQDRVKKDATQLCTDIKENKASYDNNLGNIQLDKENQSNIQKYSDAKMGLYPSDDVLTWVENMIIADEKSHSENDILLDEVTGKLATINQGIGQAEQDKKARESLKAANERLPSETDILVSAESVLNSVKAKQPQNEAVKLKVAEIELSLPKYQQLQLIINEIMANTAKLAENKQLIVDTESQLANNTISLEKAKAEVQDLSNTEVLVESMQNKEVILSTRKSAINTLSATYKDYNDILFALKTAQDDYTSKSKIADTKRSEYEALHKIYLDEQAGVLSAELKDGEACPVCGSTKHPKLAVCSASAPSKSTLDKAKKAADTAKADESNASAEANKLKGQAESMRTNITATSSEFLENVKFDDIPTALEMELNKVTTEIENISLQLTEQKKHLQRKMKLRKSIPELESNHTSFTNIIASTKEQIASLTSKIEAGSKTRDNKIEELKFKNENEAKSEIISLKNIQKNFEEALQKSQTNFDTAKTRVEHTNAEIHTLTTQLSNSVQVDLDALYEKKMSAESTQKMLIEANRSINTRVSTNKNVHSTLVKTTNAMNELNAQYKWLKELSDTANGELSGKEKVKLETYIQAAYFDRILARANVKLLHMSNAQYELKRRTAGGKQGQSGLDLNVIDHHNGTERDVKSLSGGESFIAALSLALGLSDEIQNNAGGIRLDSMFVDEGFDSLDDTKLTQVIQALSEISQSKRIIGIISHVAGLKEKIEKKIVITKQRTGGSKAELTID